MSRFYDVVCLKCGEVYEWCKYDPPYEVCTFCGCRLSDERNDGRRWNKNAKVYGAWSTSEEVYEVSREARIKFFKERGEEGFRFKTANGLLCTVKLEEFPMFWFRFRVDGEEASLLYDGSWKLAEIVKSLKECGKAPLHNLLSAVYRGQLYSPEHHATVAIIKAIEKKIRPEVVAAADL